MKNIKVLTHVFQHMWYWKDSYLYYFLNSGKGK